MTNNEAPLTLVEQPRFPQLSNVAEMHPKRIPYDHNLEINKIFEEAKTAITANISGLQLVMASAEAIVYCLSKTANFNPRDTALLALRKHEVSEALSRLTAGQPGCHFVEVWVSQFVPAGTRNSVIWDLVDFALTTAKNSPTK